MVVLFLPCLVRRIRRVRSQFEETESYFHLHDNARPHTVIPLKKFLEKEGVPELNNPPHILVIYRRQTCSYSEKSNPH
jgi:hypothetical protein